MFQWLRELSTYSALFCPGWHGNGIDKFLNIFRFTDMFVTAVLYVLGFVLKDLYLVFFGLSLTIDSLINYGLLNVIQQNSPNPGCGTQYGMPSTQAEAVTVLYIMMTSYFLFWWPRAAVLSVFCTSLVYGSTILAQLELGYNTPSQVLIGICVGTFEGLIFQNIVHLLLTKYGHTIMRFKPVIWLGYRNVLTPEL